MNPIEQLLQRITPVEQVAELLQDSWISQLNADFTIIVNGFGLKGNALVTLRHQCCLSRFHGAGYQKRRYEPSVYTQNQCFKGY
jgi:hypothetical protein